MQEVSAEALATISTGPRLYTYVSSLTEQADGAFTASGLFGPSDGYVLTGAVSINRGQAARRTARLQVANPAGVWTPREADDVFSLFSLVRIERGVHVPSTGVIDRVPLGVFVVVDVEVATNGQGQSTLDASLVDLTARAEIAALREPLVVPGGTMPAVAALQLAQAIGLVRGAYDYSDRGLPVDSTVVFDRKTVGLPALLGFAKDHGLEAYFDAQGQHVLRPIPDPLVAEPVWQFITGTTGNILTSVRRTLASARIRNAVRVEGQSAARGLVWYEARDTNPASPTLWGGRMGDRPAFHDSADIHTAEQAQAVAEPLLVDLCLAQSDYQLGLSNNPLLEAGDVVQAQNTTTGVATNLRAEVVQQPLDTTNTTFTSSEVRALS